MKTNAKHRILLVLWDRRWHPWWDVQREGGAQFQTRIKELRDRGIRIAQENRPLEGRFDRKKESHYRLVTDHRMIEWPELTVREGQEELF